MKVLFLLGENLALDIEAARREIPEVKDGKAEICVVYETKKVAYGILEEVFENYPCIAYLWGMDVEYETVTVHAYNKNLGRGNRLCSADFARPCDILESGDRIFARRVSREEREFIDSILGNRECDIHTTV